MVLRKQALAHFREVDPVIYSAAVKHVVKLSPPQPSEVYFERLCRSIVGQQLSTKAAATIWGRFEELVGSMIQPEIVLKIEHEKYREAGLSNAKARYVRGIAEAVVEREIELESVGELEDEEVVEYLTRLKGVGRWTAEMFCMFTLGRSDLFSVGDLGLKRAVEKLYGLENPRAEELVVLAEKWSPYRTYACRVLWESLDNNPDV